MDALIHPTTAVSLQSLSSNKTTSLVFYGPKSVGKMHYAMSYINDNYEYPEVILVSSVDDGSIGIELIQELVIRLSRRANRAGQTRYILIDEANKMGVEAQNALLKLIEEPPQDSRIMLLVDHKNSLLDTIISRCESYYFGPLTREQIRQYLVLSGIKNDLSEQIADVSLGLPGLAIRLSLAPELLSRHVELKQMAKTFTRQALFERLQFAEAISKNAKESRVIVSYFLEYLESAIKPGSVKTVSDALGGLLRYEERLAAHVAPRIALEGLMLAL